MSITPINEPPDPDERSGDTPSRRSSIRTSVGRFASWLAARVTEVKQSIVSKKGERTETRTQSVRATSVAHDTIHVGTTRPSGGLTEYDRPFSSPTRELPDERGPTVISIETERGLRLSVPENPDETLTSDVWVTVEP